MTRVTTLLTCLILTAASIHGQGLEPLDLAKKIFGKEKVMKMGSFITGEYKGRPNGKDLQKGSTTTFTLLGQTATTAVVAMTVLDTVGKGLDTYLHFKKENTWKMSAFRALAMTGMIEQIKMELEKMTPQQVDTIISKSKASEKEKGFALFSSREDYDFQLGNAKLILELDSNIIQHFLNNKAAFESIKEMAFKELETPKTDGERNIRLLESSKSTYQKLFISSISYGGYETGSNSLNFLIGGMLDNTVGYLYVKDKKDLPKMNPSNIIMIREIGNGWYVYKTT